MFLIRHLCDVNPALEKDDAFQRISVLAKSAL